MQRYQVLSRLPEKPCETLWRYEALISRPIMWYRRTHPRTQTLAHTHTHMHTFTNTYTHSYIHTHWPWRVVERKTKRECDTEETLGRRNMLWFYQPVERSLKARDDTDIEAMREWKQDRLKQTEENGCESMGKSWKYIHTHIPGQTRNWSLQCPLTCKNTHNEHVHEHTLKNSLSAFMPNMDTLYARAYPSFAEYCARRHKGWLAASWNSQTVHHKYMW